MSELGPSGQGSNPFGSFFGDMMKMFVSDGPVNWQLARQAALVTATGGESEPNVDPLERLRLEELLRVADLHVSDATGLSTSQTGGIVSVRAVTRAEWAYYSLDAYRDLLEALARSLSPGTPDAPTGVAPAPGSPAAGPARPSAPTGIEGPTGAEALPGAEGLLGNLAQVLGPVMLGAQSGSLAGSLARRALGQYDLPIPRPPADDLLMVPLNITSFADDWSLPVDDLRLWVCLSELAHHAVLGVPHVRARFTELLLAYAGGFVVDPDAIGTKLESLDLSDPQAFPDLFGDPEALMGAVSTPAQADIRAELGALVAALEGYVDHIVDRTGHRLIGSYASLTEAMRRRRVEAADADRLIEQLLGVTLDTGAFDRGTAFVRGVLERAGDAGLDRLWTNRRTLPTPAEIDAPGLWLERIDLPDPADD